MSLCVDQAAQNQLCIASYYGYAAFVVADGLANALSQGCFSACDIPAGIPPDIERFLSRVYHGAGRVEDLPKDADYVTCGNCYLLASSIVEAIKPGEEFSSTNMREWAWRARAFLRKYTGKGKAAKLLKKDHPLAEELHAFFRELAERGSTCSPCDDGDLDE